MPVTTDKTDPRYYQTHIYQRFPRALGAPPLPQMPDQVTMRIRLQPIGLDVLNDLVDGGDLDAGVAGGDARPSTWHRSSRGRRREAACEQGGAPSPTRRTGSR
jgi:hypothetical protein